MFSKKDVIKNNRLSYKIRRSDARAYRLAKNHIQLDDLCQRSKKITYEIVGHYSSNQPPSKYHIVYHVRSITGIDTQTQLPIYGDTHRVYIDFPPKYPSADGTPIFKVVTDVWHPNIQYHNTIAKGRICVDIVQFPSWDLEGLVPRIGQLLQYKDYHAQNTAPYPEDETVARWVRDFAEPNNIVNKQYKICTDDSDLLEPLPGFEPKPPLPKPKIVIRNRPPKPNTEPLKKERKKLIIRPKNNDLL